MNLEEVQPGIVRPVRHSLSDNEPRFLVLRANRLTVTPSVRDGDGELGRLSMRFNQDEVFVTDPSSVQVRLCQAGSCSNIARLAGSIT